MAISFLDCIQSIVEFDALLIFLEVTSSKCKEKKELQKENEISKRLMVYFNDIKNSSMKDEIP